MRRLLPLPTETDVDPDVAYAIDREPPLHVRANMVASADGAATASGRTEALSNPVDQALFKLLRDHADAVLVGAATVRIEGYRAPRPDDARRARREANGVAAVPRIAVVSGRLDLDASAPFFTAAQVPPIVVTAASAPGAQRAALADVAEIVVAGDAHVDIGAAVDALAGLGVRRLLCEGGPHLLSQLVAAGRLDELCLTLSPQLVAGDAMRILTGAALPAAVPLRLGHVLEQDDYLFLRYAAGAPTPP